MRRILVTGSNGQIGTELVESLRTRAGVEFVLATDVRQPQRVPVSADFPFELLDVTDGPRLDGLVRRYEIDTIYHLASLLSASGESSPDLTWKVNVDGLKQVLDASRKRGCRVFWPSSIAVFGEHAPGEHTPQHTVLAPGTIYGVTKVSGELLCHYYYRRYGVDVRSVRYPGIVSYKTAPGGGTTDYAVDMLRSAAADAPYTCFLRADTRLPMMYMPDAVEAALLLMEADPGCLTVRTSYNISAMTFSPESLCAAIQKHVPSFTCQFEPDERQRIADTWPATIDDSAGRQDWNWKAAFDLDGMVSDMLANLRKSE